MSSNLLQIGQDCVHLLYHQLHITCSKYAIHILRTYAVLEIPTGPPVRGRQLWRRTGNFSLIFLWFYVYDLRFKTWGPTTFLTEFPTLNIWVEKLHCNHNIFMSIRILFKRHIYLDDGNSFVEEVESLYWNLVTMRLSNHHSFYWQHTVNVANFFKCTEHFVNYSMMNYINSMLTPHFQRSIQPHIYINIASKCFTSSAHKQKKMFM